MAVTSAALIYGVTILAIYIFIYKQERLFRGMNVTFAGFALIAMGFLTEQILGINEATNIMGWVIIGIGGLMVLVQLAENSGKFMG